MTLEKRKTLFGEDHFSGAATKTKGRKGATEQLRRGQNSFTCKIAAPQLATKRGQTRVLFQYFAHKASAHATCKAALGVKSVDPGGKTAPQETKRLNKPDPVFLAHLAQSNPGNSRLEKRADTQHNKPTHPHTFPDSSPAACSRLTLKFIGHCPRQNKAVRVPAQLPVEEP